MNKKINPWRFMYKASKIWQQREMKYKKFFLQDADVV